MRLDNLQDEARGARSVEGIAATLEHRHATRGGEPVRRCDRAERPAELGARREHRSNLTVRVFWV